MRLVELNGGPLDGLLMHIEPAETILIPIQPQPATYKLTCMRNNRILYRYIPTPKP